jgi:hypothetical protein
MASFGLAGWGRTELASSLNESSFKSSCIAIFDLDGRDDRIAAGRSHT